MREFRADRRVRRASPDAGRRSLLAESARRYLDEKICLARLLIGAERAGEHLAGGYANVIDFAAREFGLPRRDLPLLLDLGRSLSLTVVPASAPASEGASAPASMPDSDGAGSEGGTATSGLASSDVPETVEERIASGRLTVENAAALGELTRDGGLVPQAEQAEWLRQAETVDPRQFRRDVRKRVESAKQAERTVAMHLEVTESARDDFRRARTVAARRARRLLSDGQVFALVVRSYLRTEDQRQRGAKQRRVPDTATVTSSRYVPAEVQRTVRDRAHDHCEVPGCSNEIFLELMHVGTPHAQGGDREAGNLALGCATHHVLLDAGVIRFDGWADDGRPRFVDPKGRLITTSRAGGDSRVSARAGNRSERLPAPDLRPALWDEANGARGPP